MGVWLGAASWVRACELCAIYSADSARGERNAGWVMTLSEAFISYHTVLLNDHEVSGHDLDYRDSSVTHLVPGYNFSPRLGLNLNVPLVYHHFKRTDLQYSLTDPPVLRTERGSEFGLGDVSLIGRWTAFEKWSMEGGFAINVLGGVKFPTGDTDRIEDEVEQSEIFEALLPPGTPHDPLGHSLSGIHEHDLSPGSGSFDGIFQYYLRTEGESGLRYGDEIMISGGPGAYLLLGDSYTLNLQANAGYDSKARDELDGQISNRTGSTAWYLGPQLGLTLGGQFSTVAGVDIPLHITANGLQNVPDYRVHASFVWRF
jgi:hypothetical protein